MEPSTLIEEIELCREQMIELSHTNSLTSTRVLEVSTRLDRLLNQYKRLNRQSSF